MDMGKRWILGLLFILMIVGMFHKNAKMHNQNINAEIQDNDYEISFYDSNARNYSRNEVSQNIQEKEWSITSKLKSTRGSVLSADHTQPEEIQLEFNDKKIPIPLWPKDSNCSEYTVRFVKNFNTGYLVSFPRSGNSWIRYLLEASIGVFTSSIYRSKMQRRAGRIGERFNAKNHNTILCKAHNFRALRKAPKSTPVVLLIRNPARAIVSLWNYHEAPKRRRHTYSVGMRSYDSKGFHRFVNEKLARWIKVYAYGVKEQKNVHVVFYEKLRENTLEELRLISGFLRIRVDEGRLACLEKHLDGSFKGRQREVYPYTKEETIAISQIINQLNALLQERGYSKLPDYDQYTN